MNPGALNVRSRSDVLPLALLVAMFRIRAGAPRVLHAVLAIHMVVVPGAGPQRRNGRQSGLGYGPGRRNLFHCGVCRPFRDRRRRGRGCFLSCHLDFHGVDTSLRSTKGSRDTMPKMPAGSARTGRAVLPTMRRAAVSPRLKKMQAETRPAPDDNQCSVSRGVGRLGDRIN